MIAAQDKKVIGVTFPVAIVDNASWTTVEIDTLGYDYAEFIWVMGANDIAVAALKVQESDTSGSGMADVTGAIFGTSANDAGSTSTLPSATDDNKLFSICLDLTRRKRYLDLVATNGDGTAGGFSVCVCVLTRAEQSPSSAAEAGYSQRLIV